MWQVESLVKHLYKKFASSEVFRGTELPDDPFLQMPYQTAMSWYGSDKPDLRIQGRVNLSNFLLGRKLIGIDSEHHKNCAERSRGNVDEHRESHNRRMAT